MRLSVTGHQPPALGGFDRATIDRIDRFAVIVLGSFRDQYGSPDSLFTGMAPGWDLAMAKAARYFNIPYAAVLAHKDQGNNWPPEAKVELDGLLKCADFIHIVGDVTDIDRWAYRDLYILDRSDVVLALWDKGLVGGTAKAVEAARQRNLQVLNVWDDWVAYNINNLGS